MTTDRLISWWILKVSRAPSIIGKVFLRAFQCNLDRRKRPSICGDRSKWSLWQDCFAKKYKLVALKVKPVFRTLPERFRITQEIIDNPLKDMPKLPEWPPEFQSRERYNLEQKDRLDKLYPQRFLWSEEQKLMHWLVAEQNQAFAWDNSERRNFKEEFSPLVEILTVAYIPCYDSELLTRSNCNRNPRQPCILSSPPARGSG